MKKRASSKPRTSFSRTFKFVAQDPRKAKIVYQLGKVGKLSLLNGVMITMNATSEGTVVDESGIPTTPSGDVCALGHLDVNLTDVQYVGADLGVPKWSVDIHFEILPIGGVTDTPVPNMAFDAAGKYSVVTPIFGGPGIFCGRECVPSTLVFHIQVQGTGADGVQYTSVGDAVILQSPTGGATLSIPPVPLKVIEPLPPPQPNQRPRRPREADLWFLFSVASMC